MLHFESDVGDILVLVTTWCQWPPNGQSVSFLVLGTYHCTVLCQDDTFCVCSKLENMSIFGLSIFGVSIFDVPILYCIFPFWPTNWHFWISRIFIKCVNLWRVNLWRITVIVRLMEFRGYRLFTIYIWYLYIACKQVRANRLIVIRSFHENS